MKRRVIQTGPGGRGGGVGGWWLGKSGIAAKTVTLPLSSLQSNSFLSLARDAQVIPTTPPD